MWPAAPSFAPTTASLANNRPGEVEYPVPPLAGTEAVELFATRSQLEPDDQVVAPLDRRAQRLLPSVWEIVGSTSSGSRSEARPTPRPRLKKSRRKDARPRGGELDGERQVVETCANLKLLVTSRELMRIDPEDAVPKLRYELGRGLDRQAGLPRAARTTQRHDPRAAEPLDDLRHFPGTADERARGPREVRVRDRLQRRKALAAELVDPDRIGEVLQAVLPEIAGLSADQVARHLREQDLAAVAGCGDARAEVHVLADVTLLRDMRRPGVDPHSNADSSPGEGVVRPPRGVQRAGGPPGRRRRRHRPACRPPRRPPRRTSRAPCCGARPAPLRRTGRRARAAARSNPPRP
jgi:hypothetical protein